MGIKENLVHVKVVRLKKLGSEINYSSTNQVQWGGGSSTGEGKMVDQAGSWIPFPRSPCPHGWAQSSWTPHPVVGAAWSGYSHNLQPAHTDQGDTGSKSQLYSGSLQN